MALQRMEYPGANQDVYDADEVDALVMRLTSERNRWRDAYERVAEGIGYGHRGDCMGGRPQVADPDTIIQSVLHDRRLAEEAADESSTAREGE